MPLDVASVRGTGRTVLLTQSPAQAGHAPIASEDKAAARRATREHSALLNLYTQVNHRLSRICTSVPAATRLWTRIAAAAGYRQATLAWRRKVNEDPRADDGMHFTLYQQPASQPTGRCAHVLVINEGGGTTDVYVARIHP